jgi:hypothetical protein
LETKRFVERIQGFSKAKNVVTGEALEDLTKLTLRKNAPLVLELAK